MSSNSNSDKDVGEAIAALAGLAIAAAIIFAIVLAIVNGTAWLLSHAAAMIDYLSIFPLAILNLFGFQNDSLAIQYSIGWFTFFTLIGCATSVLLAHIALPTETPTKPFNERGVLQWEIANISICLILFFSFAFILWKY